MSPAFPALRRLSWGQAALLPLQGHAFIPELLRWNKNELYLSLLSSVPVEKRWFIFYEKKYASCKHQSNNNLELTPHRFSFHLNQLIQFVVARLQLLLHLFNVCWVKESGTTTAKGFRKWRFCLPCPSCSWLLCNFHSQEPVLYKASGASAPSEAFQSTSSKDRLPMALPHCHSYSNNNRR